MTSTESQSIVSWLAPELPEEIPRNELVRGLIMFANEHEPGDIIMFHEDTCVDTDESDFLFAPYPETQKVTGDDEWGSR